MPLNVQEMRVRTLPKNQIGKGGVFAVIALDVAGQEGKTTYNVLYLVGDNNQPVMGVPYAEIPGDGVNTQVERIYPYSEDLQKELLEKALNGLQAIKKKFNGVKVAHNYRITKLPDGKVEIVDATVKEEAHAAL